MKKKIFLKESNLRQIISNILEQVEDNDQYYKISADDYESKLEIVNYRGDILTGLKTFKGKPFWITGDLSLNDLPVSTLGNVARIDGNLDISNTNIGDISNIKISGRVYDYNSKIDKLRKAAEIRKKRAEAEVRRESGEWDIENADETGLKANALFEWLVEKTEIESLSEEEKEELTTLKERLSELKEDFDPENTYFENGPIYVEIKEIEEKIDVLESQNSDVYDIVPTKYEHWGLQQFEVIGLGDRSYTVGTQSEMDDAVLEYAKSSIDESGIDGFSKSFLYDYIDKEELETYIYDFYYDDVSQNPDVYFDEDDFELTEEQEKRKKELENYISEMEDMKSNLEDEQKEIEDSDSDEYNKIDEKIDKINDNIDTAQNEIDSIEPDTEPTDEMIEDKVDDYVSERLRDPVEFIEEFGLDLEDFIDKDELAQGYVDADGYGIMNSHDGDYDTVYLNDTEYYIMRVD